MIIRPFSVAAFVLTCFSFCFVVIGFFLPQWWIVNTAESSQTFGLWIVTDCLYDKCVVKTTDTVQGGKEFLLVTKLFEIIGVGLVTIALLLHTIYIPVRKVVLRSTSTYALGSAGLFLLLAVFIFAGKHKDLVLGNRKVIIGASFYISLLGGVLTIIASIVTAVAQIQKAKRHDGDDEEQPKVYHL